MAAPAPLRQLGKAPVGLPVSKAPQLSVVIVNYRHWKGTARLARHILAEPAGRCGRAEVVVVDNHSPKHPLIAKLRRDPGVSLRRWRYNRGFGSAANEGCRLSRGEWILLLNPDVTLPPGFLEGALELAATLTHSEPRAGVVGFQLRNSDGTQQWSAGPWPTLASTVAGLALPRESRKCRPVRSRQLCRVKWVTGCCMLIRRECWQQIGGFDEDFFLYYEDVDFCKRARANGFTVWHEPRLHAVHHRPLHGRKVSAPLRLVTRHALLTYAAKHWPPRQAAYLSAIVGVEARVRQWWAKKQNRPGAARIFGALAILNRDLFDGRARAVRNRLKRVVRHL